MDKRNYIFLIKQKILTTLKHFCEKVCNIVEYPCVDSKYQKQVIALIEGIEFELLACHITSNP